MAEQFSLWHPSLLGQVLRSSDGRYGEGDQRASSASCSAQSPVWAPCRSGKRKSLSAHTVQSFGLKFHWLTKQCSLSAIYLLSTVEVLRNDQKSIGAPPIKMWSLFSPIGVKVAYNGFNQYNLTEVILRYSWCYVLKNQAAFTWFF